mgnify:CR=1 FL=1
MVFSVLFASIGMTTIRSTLLIGVVVILVIWLAGTATPWIVEGAIVVEAIVVVGVIVVAGVVG